MTREDVPNGSDDKQANSQMRRPRRLAICGNFQRPHGAIRTQNAPEISYSSNRLKPLEHAALRLGLEITSSSLCRMPRPRIIC